MDLYIDIFLAIFFCSVAVFYTSLILIRQRKTSCSKLVHQGPKYSQHWWNHLTFRVFRISITLYCVVRLWLPELDSLLLPIDDVNHIAIRTLGSAMMLTGFMVAVVANISLKQSWRSGIDSSIDELISFGLYRLSRNPGYMGVLCAQLGFFLALPNVFTLTCFIVGSISIFKQVQLEEAFLSKQFGAQYQNYRARVRRWL